MSVKVEAITEPVVLAVGEGPHWDSRRQALYFISVMDEYILHKYCFNTKTHTKTKIVPAVGNVGFIIPLEGSEDEFVVGLQKKFLVVRWDGKEGSPATVVREIAEVDQEFPENRINDGEADPRGRLFSGTMCLSNPYIIDRELQGSLYRVGSTGAVRLDRGIGMSNGLAWDLNEKAMYYIDTTEANVRRYDYDVETGDISNKRHIFDFKKHNITGLPDGCTIDTEGNLLVAVFHGGGLLHIDPRTGTLLRKISIPADQVTSATFGGPNLDILFVTTGSITNWGDQPPPSGSTFMVTGLGIKGHPSVNVKLD